MSKQLQRIARFALERPDPLALDTVAADRQGGARAAVVDDPLCQRARLFRIHGDAAGLPRAPGGALRELPRAHRGDAPQARRSGNGGDAATGVLHQFVSESIDELGHLEEVVAAPQFRAAVRLLAGARRIHVVAQRRAFPVAFYFAYALNQLELTTHLLDGVGGMLRELVRGHPAEGRAAGRELPQLLAGRHRGGGRPATAAGSR